MTRYDDPRLNGRNPEFCRSSNRRGIGYGSVAGVADALRHWGFADDVDVPLGLMSGDKRKPLGRYLRQQLRVALGRDVKAPQEVLDAMAAELLPVRTFAFNTSQSFKEVVKEVGIGEYENFMAKQRLYQKGGSI